MQPFAAVAGQRFFFLLNGQVFTLAQELINGLTPNLIGLASQIAPTARDPSLGVQRAFLQAESRQVPRQFYSGQVVEGNASFTGYLKQYPISAAIAVLPALTGGQSATALADMQEESKQPVLSGHSSTDGQHLMNLECGEETRKNLTPQVRGVWSSQALQIDRRGCGAAARYCGCRHTGTTTISNADLSVSNAEFAFETDSGFKHGISF